MSSTTTYTVFTNDVAGESRSRKGKAVEQAEIALANDATATVEVRTSAGNVVWPEATEAEVTPTEDGEVTTSNRARPYTRTDESEALPAEVDGYELAYTRNRVNAGVYRSGKEYLVVQFDKAGDEIMREDAANTKEAREITNRLADEHREAQEAAKAKAKAEKDAEKAAKLAAKEKAAADAAAEAELVDA